MTVYLSSVKRKMKLFALVWHQEGRQVALQRGFKWLKKRFFAKSAYKKWVIENQLTYTDILNAKKEIETWEIKPRFSIIMPVYNIDKIWLKKAIQSVQNQIYQNWELCIADDASTKPYIKQLLTQYSKLDPRIKVTFRSKNSGISAASNDALSLATGDYIALLDHDDELAIEALYENAKLINQHPEADFIYSDEDKFNILGERSDSFLKPSWMPEYFHACMYTCHLGVYRTQLIQKIGGFRSEYDGAQDYDLVLRVVEQTQNIYHIPKILYHWRTIPSSVSSGEQVKPWAHSAGQKALQAMLDRSPYPGTVEQCSFASAVYFRVRRKLLEQPLISILLPSAGKQILIENEQICLLGTCIQSILKKSSYQNFEFIIIDGHDISTEVFDRIYKLLAEAKVADLKIVHCDQPFNYSMRINHGALVAKGEYLLLLNDDTEVITSDWLESMLEFAQQTDVGAVGAKLLFPDGRIQHAGVIVVGQNPVHACYGFDGSNPGYVLSNIVNRDYLAVTGACTLVRREYFEQVNGLDEAFNLNYNDVDFCLKLHKAGYRNVMTPFAQLIHYESMTRPAIVKPEEINLFRERWMDYINSLEGDPYYNPNFAPDPFFRFPY